MLSRKKYNKFISYDLIDSIEFEATCSDFSEWTMHEMEALSLLADKHKVNMLIKKFYPDMYKNIFNEKLYNPYRYWKVKYKSKYYLVAVHSSIDYFFRVNLKN